MDVMEVCKHVSIERLGATDLELPVESRGYQPTQQVTSQKRRQFKLKVATIHWCGEFKCYN